MKYNSLSFAKRTIGIGIAIALTVLFLAACISPSSTSVSQNNLALIQQNGNLSVRFFSVMTFSSSGTLVTAPSELGVSGVPINWMGVIFNGRLEEFLAGEDTTDEVHGSVSADGNWIESMYYSRQILRTTANPSGTFYRISLKSVPISGAASGSTLGPGNFEKSSGDIQKYITQIEYADGPVIDSKINSITKYISTDWGNTFKGQIPTLKLTFAQGSGNLGKTPTKSGMMGQ